MEPQLAESGVNPVTHQILRFYEGTKKDYEHQWSLYLIDLTRKSVKKLLDLEEPFVEGTADGLPHFQFKIFYKTIMFNETNSWSIDYVLWDMAELRKKDMEELEQKKNSSKNN